MSALSDSMHVRLCPGCGWLLTKSLFPLDAEQCNSCREKGAVMSEQSTNGAAPTFGGVCDACLCVYDHRGKRTYPLSEAQYSVLQSVRSKSKSRGMCKMCFTIEGTAAVIRKSRGDNRIASCCSKDDDYTEAGSSGEEGGIQ